MAAGWRAGKLYSCEFVKPNNLHLKPSQVPPNRHSELESALERYFHTGKLAWDFESLDLADLTAFQKQVLRCCWEIPTGESISYGCLAERAGSPGAARAAGMVMAKNRWPIIIPCHRVVGSSGKLIGYSGTGGLSTKRRLLQLEEKAPTQLPLFDLREHAS